MPRPLILLIAFSLFSATVYGQEAKAPSPAVKRILDEAVRDIRVNRQAFDKANQKPLGEARKALEDLSTKLIKDGKTEEAGVVLKQVGTLEADVMKLANAPAPLAGGGAVPQKPLLETLEGRWDRTAHQKYVQISKDGSAAHLFKTNNKVDTTGRITAVTPDVAEVRWLNGYRWELRMAGEDMIAVKEWTAKGEPTGGAVLERIK